MAVTSSGRPSHLQIPSKWRDSETSPDRISPAQTGPSLPFTPRKVPVVYYLSMNGQLEHPHFMEVPLSSPRGLFLRDVMNRLNLLRGKGMALMYSWSSKRSYRTGFVWHDLTENDLIYPSHGQEYVLKGSDLLDPPLNHLALETASSRSLRPQPEALKSGDDFDSPVILRRRNQSWSSIDLNEYKVYKTESVGESTGKAAADASTQTDDKRHRRRVREEHDEKGQGQSKREVIQILSHGTELSRDEISPPPSYSSPETLESLMKADGRLVLCADGVSEEAVNRTAEVCPTGKLKASTVLMQLISCGSTSFRDCGSTAVREQGLSLVGHYKPRLRRGVAENHAGTETIISKLAGVKMEDKEYFSGSLIETNKEAVPSLKRSSSYNADRSAQLQLEQTEKDGVRAKCIPRKPRGIPTKKEINHIASSSDGGGSNSRNSHVGGSKRLEVRQ
ncbi:protein SOSEKI 5-like isoform X2 [Pyrus communis]|uniref:protein SOSEKI 5-like isoform X2 n=1 Tax=Pyrus communis TaxID=23211 RepID=UPI0035C2424E